MINLSYRNNRPFDRLFVENCDIEKIAKQVGTPFYCYSKSELVTNYQRFVDAFSKANIADYKICYAIKANANLHLVKVLSDLGSGIDAVSAGEIFRAKQSDINPRKIVFAGVGKSREEIEYALKEGVEEFSVESIPEMFLLNDVARSLSKKAKFSLRVNPDVDAKTIDKISTGRKTDKFGVDIELAREIYRIAAKLEGLEVYGIATHIGSQITSLDPFKKAFKKIRELFLTLREDGHNIQNLDFGGGIGILYKDESSEEFDNLLQHYAKLISDLTRDLNVKITIAPGRAIIGNAGILVTKVNFIKETTAKNFVIIDAAMNDLMRPGLYDSYHEILPVSKKDGVKKEYDLAGPVCESTDILAKKRKLVEPKSGDLIAICSAGAYGSSLSNEYNARPLIPEVLVDGDAFKVVRKRPTFEEMIALEK
ncbi:MAG: diaminopimelate decarboxylase [Rickettsiales bacterium]|nr:diaminopimelate decarboxylase [Rickettsiales bacterium]